MRLDVDAARDLLVETVRVIHDVEAVEVTVVFDSNRDLLAIEHPGNQETFAVVFAPAGTTADGIIELLVQRIDPRYRREVTVVSRDNMIAESVRASGAVVVHTPDLLDWVARCDARQSDFIRKKRREQNRNWNNDNPWSALP